MNTESVCANWNGAFQFPLPTSSICQLCVRTDMCGLQKYRMTLIVSYVDS